MTTGRDAPAATAATTDASPRVGWNPLTRVLFGFCFLYFGLYVATTQMLGGLIVVPGDWNLPEVETIPNPESRIPERD